MKKSTTAILMVGSPDRAPDIRYATGFDAPDPVILFQAGMRRRLAVPVMEAARARRTAHGWRVLTWDELKSKQSDAYKISELVLRLLKCERERSVTVPMDFPVGLADALRNAGIRVNVSDAHLFPARAQKSRQEIAWIRQSQRAAVQCLERALSILRASAPGPGKVLYWRGKVLTSERLRSEMHQVLLAHDCDGFETIAACGPASASPHERGYGPLQASQPIVLDIFPRGLKHGYWGDLTRTVVKGRPQPCLARMYEAVKKAQRAALRVVRARVECKNVHLAACKVFEEMGFSTDMRAQKPKGFIHSTGHGVGLEVHELPSVSMRPGRLRAGNVITIEPGLYDPEIGGVRIEDTIEVTGRGWKFVGPAPEVFVL